MADDNSGSTLDTLRSSRILAYSVGLVTLAAGVLLLFWPDRTVTVVARFAGILILVAGIAESWEAVTAHRKGDYWGLLLLRGLVNIAFGGVLLFWPGPTITVIAWLFGLDLLVTGLLGLIVFRKVPKDYGRASLMTRSFVSIVVGVVVIVWPSETLTVLAILVGAMLALLGVLLLWSGWTIGRAAHTISSP
jgi:uncharacterized membrane protein HdeD (DUF308 family)